MPGKKCLPLKMKLLPLCTSSQNQVSGMRWKKWLFILPTEIYNAETMENITCR